jgi:hypothetical protein
MDMEVLKTYTKRRKVLYKLSTSRWVHRQIKEDLDFFLQLSTPEISLQRIQNQFQISESELLLCIYLQFRIWKIQNCRRITRTWEYK